MSSSEATTDDPLEREALFRLLCLDVATRLNEAIDSSGIAMEELFRRSGLKPERIREILSGDNDITLKEISLISCAVGAEPSFALASDQTAHERLHQRRRVIALVKIISTASSV